MTVPLADSIVPQSRSSYDRATSRHYVPHPRSASSPTFSAVIHKFLIISSFLLLSASVRSCGTLDCYSVASLYEQVIYDVLNFDYGFHWNKYTIRETWGFQSAVSLLASA